MTSITITLPDDLAEEAKAKGFLLSAAFESYIRDRLREEEDEFDPRLYGLVNPTTFRRGEIVGDIVSPLDVKWEADS